MKKYINYDFFIENKIILDKRGQLESIKLSPILIKNVDQNKRREFIEQVKLFLTVMNEQCPSFNFDLFRKNFSKMKFKFYVRKNKTTGMVIFLFKKCKIYDMSAVLHELIHIATIRSDGFVEYCGFSINDYFHGDSFARGLNEGYTQLLKERYFGKEHQIIYPLELQYSSMIEALVGKETMEKLYFNVNLKGLFQELATYTDASNFRSFLSDLDYINRNFPPTDENAKEIQVRIDNLNIFLFECFKEKLKLEPNNTDVLNTMKSLFIESIKYKYSNGKKVVTIKGLDKKLLDDYLNNKEKKIVIN